MLNSPWFPLPFTSPMSYTVTAVNYDLLWEKIVCKFLLSSKKLLERLSWINQNKKSLLNTLIKLCCSWRHQAVINPLFMRLCLPLLNKKFIKYIFAAAWHHDNLSYFSRWYRRDKTVLCRSFPVKYAFIKVRGSKFREKDKTKQRTACCSRVSEQTSARLGCYHSD